MPRITVKEVMFEQRKKAAEKGQPYEAGIIYIVDTDQRAPDGSCPVTKLTVFSENLGDSGFVLDVDGREFSRRGNGTTDFFDLSGLRAMPMKSRKTGEILNENEFGLAFSRLRLKMTRFDSKTIKNRTLALSLQGK